MPRTEREGLENALLAVDACVRTLDANLRTLVMARGILEEQLEAKTAGSAPSPLVPTQADPHTTMGGLPDLPACEHLNCQERQTMGSTWFLCTDCKEMIDPSEIVR